VQDVAIQLQMGTNAMIVLGQQGGQIASLFGPKGAIVGAFISVAAAAGMSLAPKLMGVKRNFDDLESQIAETVRELNVFTAAQRDALIASEKIEKLNLAKEQIKLKQETEDLAAQIVAEQDQLESLQEKMKAAGRNAVFYEQRIDTLTESLETNRLELDLHRGQLETNNQLMALNDETIRRLTEGTDQYSKTILEASVNAGELAKREAERFEQLLEQEQKMLDAEVKARDKAERDKQSAIKATQAVQQQSLSFISSQTGQIMSMLDEQSAAYKALFLVQQATQIAQAIMSAHTAAANALAFIPPPTNVPMAKLMLALGYANAAAIAGQTIASFEGGGMIPDGPRAGGVDGRGGRMAIVHPNEKITDMRQRGDSQPVNINFNIQANDADGFDQLLIKRRGMIVNMVNKAINNRGRRSLT
jgi:hypothetical protein